MLDQHEIYIPPSLKVPIPTASKMTSQHVLRYSKIPDRMFDLGFCYMGIGDEVAIREVY